MSFLDLQAFAASTLADSEGLSAALRVLESCLAGPDVHLDLIIQDLCSVPNLFEFILSVLPNGRGLVDKILDDCPTDPALIEASYTTTLLRRLSSFTFALPPELFSTTITHQIGQYKVYVEDASRVLALLCSTDFSAGITGGVIPASTLEDPVYDDKVSPGFIVHKKGMKARRKTKETTPTVDMALFHKLGIKVPTDHAERYRAAWEIVDKFKEILKFYLELLLEPFLMQHSKAMYVSTGNATVRVPNKSMATEVVDPKGSAYSKFQPLKAALNLKNADKLGEWRIIISTNAAKNLREFARSDANQCHIVMKKIKQLSDGHFSAANQKRLNGSPGVPIFEAKMPGDLRLVYQVDVVPDHDGRLERQVIKIYGIYTHTQLDRIWNSIGHHLCGKGKEYKRRCVYRNRPMCPGDDIYLPACFPPEEPESDIKVTPLVLPDDDMSELHSLLVLEKYITFSQAFLNSLIVNRDVQHVFELAPQEQRIMKCETSCYVLGRSGTGKTTTMLFKMLGIQWAWQRHMSDGNLPKPRQIFVTKSSVLATKVEEYFTKLLESLVLAGYSLEDLKKLKAQNTELRLVDADDIDRVDLPKKFSLLEENHFPLFVTFDKLVQMTASDILTGDDPNIRHAANFFAITDEAEAKESLVTYDVFAETYWPHFPHPLPRGFEPWLVFSEFMGVIKGSELSLTCPDGFLDEPTYCGLSARTNPTFANHRQSLYVLFRAYCKLKKERRHHDIADRTNAILNVLLGGSPLNGQKVDYLYVDEAQDNLLIDALLLRLLCQNPEGLFWAGDTAQTISAGSSFRFDDLKAFLYRIERDHRMHVIQDRSISEPSVFELAINYRSHSGIVDCAHTVIECITHFWPDAIDTLKREQGTVGGSKPVFFHGWDQDTVRYEQFLFGEMGSRIEFGAEQCILVRDEKALERLRQEVGEVGLIMTLYDSKGLEFNDVLLYNFFEDSAIDASRWCVLLNNAEGEADGKDLANVHAPSFERDEGHFAAVCSELKLLYVGITRARKNLWIFDKSDKGEPMRLIWTSRSQIQNCTPETGVPHLAVSSTPAEWELFGHNLFDHKKYSQAMHCFARASLPRMEAICKAYHLRKVARSKIDVAPRKAQQDAFLAAADAFTASGDDAPLGKEKLQYYRNAAECYVRTNDNRKAAIAYRSAQEYDLAAWRFRKAGLFDDTLEILHKYSQEISQESSDKLYTACRLFCYTEQGGKKPRFPLFRSYGEELEFLEDYGFDLARAALLESHGKYSEAAEVHLTGNRPVEAIRDLLKEKRSRSTIQKATKILLDSLWHRCSFAIAPNRVAASQDVMALLDLAREFPVDFVDPLDRYEISMFQSIAKADLATLEKLAIEFLKGNRKPAALLALDHVFAHLLGLKSYKIHEMSCFLTKFMEYAQLLQFVISHTDPVGTNSIMRLFCIRKVSNTEYSLEPGTFLYRSATGDRSGPLHPQHSVTALSKNVVAIALRRYLGQRLRERVMEENELCCNSPVFSHCLSFSVTGHCDRTECPQEHVESDELDIKRYNLRLGIHLQQIHILQLMYSVVPCPHLHRGSVMLDWLTHLYEAFKPQSHVQGSIADLDLSPIPGAHEGMRVMKHWVRDALINPHPGRRDSLTTVLRAYFNAQDARIPELIYPDGHYAIEDIVKFFDGTTYDCISAGLMFLSHVVKSSQVVDLSVLCDCLEEVIGKISISCRLFDRLPLDGLILPRGWLSANKDFYRKKGVWIALIGATLGCVQDLLMRLQSDNASQTYMLLDTELTTVLCAVFTSRICRALCLLSYNVSHHDIRQKVRDIFNTLWGVDGPMQSADMYRRYVKAHDSEYITVMVGYDTEAKVVIQDLVQLIYKYRDPLHPRPPRFPRIKDIYYTSPSKILSLLSPSQPVVARPRPRADAPATASQAVPQVKKAENEAKKLEDHDTMLVDNFHEEHEPQEAAPATNELTLVHEHEPMEQEMLAAKKIQDTYRTYCRRRNTRTRAIGRGIKVEVDAVFIVCLKNVYTSNWGRSPYRNLYLWALPRLVVCLDRAMATAQKLKVKAKGLLSKESHERLEALGQQITRINTLLKKGRELRNKIEPNATMHNPENRDKAEMREAVSAVKDIIRNGLSEPAHDIQNEFDVAYRLVMFEKQLAPKPEKPELNVDDLYSDDYY